MLMLVLKAWGEHGVPAYSVPIPFDVIGYAAITHYEMCNVLLALRIWAQDLENKVVCIHCDNESAVAVIRSNKTRDRFLDVCLRNIWLICATWNIDLRVAHIKGKNNTLADALSRGKFDKLGDVTWENVSHNIFSLL